VVAVAGASLAGIVLTGGAVRLTQAGLGCENWPACTDERLVPEWSFHPWMEFGNRLLSGVVSAAVAAAVLTAYRRRPRRADLIWWSWGLVAGVLAQIVIGGVTVLADLHPALVGLHYAASIVLLWNVVVLWVRAGSGGTEATAPVDTGDLWISRLMVALAIAVLTVGTLVTGTGPNSGDARAERLQLDLTTITRVHSTLVWVLLATVVVLVIRLRRDHPAPARLGRWLIATMVAQGAVGYLQFALGVPPLPVAFHMAGSVAVWVLVLLVHLSLWARSPIEADPAEAEDSVLESATKSETMGT
jgi:cytochrome c oxidase assembly protein subunit 15